MWQYSDNIIRRKVRSNSFWDSRDVVEVGKLFHSLIYSERAQAQYQEVREPVLDLTLGDHEDLITL